MACTIKPEEIKRVKGLGFLNNKGTNLFNGRVVTVNGKITAEQTRAIADAAEKYGTGEVEFTTRLSVEIRGIPFEDIEAFRACIVKAGLETGGTGPLVRPIVSCKGTTCQYGLYDTFALSEEFHKRFYKAYHTVKLPHKFKIAVGGCPNNCVKPDVNDMGIIGRRLSTIHTELCKTCKNCKIEAACPMGAAKVEGDAITRDASLCNFCGRCIGKCPFDAIEEGPTVYKIHIGGRWGKKVARGRSLSKLFTEKEVFDIVESAILLFREQGKAGERFADTIERIGMEEVERQLVSGEVLQRKESILAE